MNLAKSKRVMSYTAPVRPATRVAGRQPARGAYRATKPEAPLPIWKGENCSILLTDIAGFSAPIRHDGDREIIRRVAHVLLRDAGIRSGIPWSRCHREDRGDGTLLIVPPDTPTSSVVDPFIADLATGLRLHNHCASDALRIQLRVALHVGPVVSDAEGVTGHSIIHAARCVESPLAKRALTATRADLAFIASTFVYEDIVKHDPGYFDPANYQKTTFRVKESKITAWMLLAGPTR